MCWCFYDFMNRDTLVWIFIYLILGTACIIYLGLNESNGPGYFISEKNVLLAEENTTAPKTINRESNYDLLVDLSFAGKSNSTIGELILVLTDKEYGIKLKINKETEIGSLVTVNDDELLMDINT